MADEKKEEKGLLKEKAKTIHTKSKKEIGFSKFLKETVVELKKVVWPTKRQLAINTAIVIIASILMSLFIGAFDTVFNYIDKLLLKG
jgi:preprotein translocase subunit SecE